MTDRNFVLRWAHLGLGRNPRQRQIIEEERRALEAHVADIQAEQEHKNAALGSWSPTVVYDELVTGVTPW